MKQTGRAGATRERMVRDYFRQRGFIAIKVSDSAICDVVAMKGSPTTTTLNLSSIEHPSPLRKKVAIVYMVEVKASARSAFADFPPAEREALIEAARQAGATPLLAYWPPHGELKLIGVEDWPEYERTGYRAA